MLRAKVQPDVEKPIPVKNRGGRFLSMRNDYFLVSFSQQIWVQPSQKSNSCLLPILV